uniref:Uncharacterized protein n=1 Tax=Avena sativa TaxID=4498 RepID=A0ACD5X123_AVESA
MDPPAETEILEGVALDHHNAPPTDDGDTPAAADAVSMVLENGDLLLEIMLRLPLPTTLVRAILVCKRWFLLASEPFSLHCFRRFHPPRLLGFYVSTRSTTAHMLLRPRFVPMPPPEADRPPPPPPESDQTSEPESEQPPPPESDQTSEPESEQPPPPESDQTSEPESEQPPPPESDQPPPPQSDQPPEHESDQPPPPDSDQPPLQEQEQELAAAIRMAETYSLDAYNEDFTVISDLQNDTLLVSGFRGKNFAVEVHRPMSPHRGVVAIPVTPCDQLDGTATTAAHFILKVHSGSSHSLAFVWLSMGLLIKGKGEYSLKYKAHIYVLQEDGQWRFRASAAAVLPSPKSDSRPLLVGTKIYLEHSTSIAALDLKTSTFSEIPLPEGMERYNYENMMLAAFYDSGVCLIHLDEDLQLFIWLHIDGGTTWLPIDFISLPEMFETLGMTGWTDDDEPATLFQSAQMGDFVEFVFLKLGKCAFCLDTRRRVLRKVYEVTQEDQSLEQLHPLMTTWPPKFPELKGDHLARNVS